MKIAIYNPYWSSKGGGERVSLELSFALKSLGHQVHLLSEIDLFEIHHYFGLEPDYAGIREIDKMNLARTTKEYDLLIFTSNFKPLRHKAKRYVQILQLPLNKPKFWESVKKLSLLGLYGAIQRWRLIRQARKAEIVLVYSRFVSDVLMENFNLDTTVLCPPCENFGGARKKKNIILSVGRIFRNKFNDKKYDVLTKAFRDMKLKGWEYHIVGGCSDDGYLSELLQANNGYDVIFHIDASHGGLKKLYQEAKIFWHGAGYGTDDPECMEHFGISTVEAMSAGCIVMVYEGGGQTGIITSGVDGHKWSTIERLLQTTKDTTKSRQTKDIRTEAMLRANDFSVSVFRQNVERIFS